MNFNPALDDDPALRDEIPACWSDEACTITGVFCFGDRVKPWNWLELDHDEAEKLWSLLIWFVAYFNRRYGERPDKRIPPCWAEHGPIVEELTTLAFARWHAFESPHGTVGGAQYWHSYTLPSFYDRIASWLGDELLACQQGRHRDRDDPPLERAASWSARTEVLAIRDIDQRGDRGTSKESAEPTAGVAVPFLDEPDDPRTPIRPRSKQ